MVGVYQDKISGTTDKRPHLSKMMESAKRQEFDAIVITKLDRLFRSTRHLLNTMHDLNQLGISVIASSDSVDLGSPVGRLTVQILASMAEFEAALGAERTKAWAKHQKEIGEPIGRPISYENESKIQMAIEEWNNVKAEMEAKGEWDGRNSPTIREIARAAQVSKSAVERYLQRH